MKCTSCQIEVNDNIKKHYLSELHVENTRRKINNIPPITRLEDRDNTNTFNNNETHTLEKFNISDKFDKIRNKNDRNNSIISINEIFGDLECFLCDDILKDNESFLNHLKSHEIEISNMPTIKELLLKMRCVFCHKKFSKKMMLKNHMIDAHILALPRNKNKNEIKNVNINTEGEIGYLENGKIIYKKEYANSNKKSTKEIVISQSIPKNQIEVHRMTGVEVKNQRKVRKIRNRYALKISLGLNFQKHFREHWLQ